MSRVALDVVQALLQAFDSSATKAYREEDKSWFKEDRAWHDEDLVWREDEYAAKTQERHGRTRGSVWREMDINQKNVENSRSLWLRFVEENRRNVEEKTEQLKAILNLSALFAGFAIVTLTQLNIDHTTDPLVFIAIYGVLTAIVEGCMAIAVFTCAVMLGAVLKGGRTYVAEAAEEEFMMRCRDFCSTYKRGDRPPYPRLSFQSFWATRCEPTWQFALNCFQAGILTFLLSMISVGWIIFYHHRLTQISWVTVMGAAVLVCVTVQYSWGSYLRRRPTRDPQGSPLGGAAGLPFDWHIAPDNSHHVDTDY